MKFIILPLLALSSFLISCTQKQEEKTTKQKPNIVLILADDLGWTDVGSYGSTFYETPNIDQLTADGIKFTSGYANCPVCSPSRVSVQTGKYPVRSGITDWIPGRGHLVGSSERDRWIAAQNDFEMDLEEKTLAEALKNYGYKTYFAGKWHLGEEEQFWPGNQGYDVNVGGYRRGAPRLDEEDSCFGYFSPYCNPRLEDGPEGEYLADRLADETAQFIQENKSQPLFICLSTYLVHTPLQAKEQMIDKYEQKRAELGLDTVQELTTDRPWMQHASNPPEKYKERLVQSHPTYAAMIQSLDEAVGRVTRMLKEQGLYENSLIIFTSDNGGLSTSEGFPTTNKPLRAGKGWMYEGGIRVPYILKMPGGAHAGSENDNPVAGMDIYPTLLKYIDENARIEENIDGVNILPYIDGEKIKERPLFWHYPHYPNQGGNPASAVRLGEYKLIHDLETGGIELYNLAEDLGETNNIADAQPEVAEQLWKLLAQWRNDHNVAMMEPNPEWNEKEPIVK